MYSLHIVYSLHILHIVHNLYISSVAHSAFHAPLASNCILYKQNNVNQRHSSAAVVIVIYIVSNFQAEQRKSKTQLSCCCHQRDGTDCRYQFRHQRDFWDILSINCIFFAYFHMLHNVYMYRKDSPLKTFHSALCQQWLQS